VTTILHLSDLHFGTETNEIVDAVKREVHEASPDLVVVSGDFTHIANNREFQKAQRIIKDTGIPFFCVPGNHDIPRFDVWERFFDPYRKYKKYIDDNLFPVWESDDVIVAGINSARRMLPHWNWANGAISKAQLDHLERVYDDTTKRRICVFHHPVHQAMNAPMDTVVFGAKRAMQRLNAMKVDLVLTGHVHHASVTTIGTLDHKTIYLSASTTLSSRLRAQSNGFNRIDITKNKIDVGLYTFDDNSDFNISERYSQELNGR
jgi:3',5'-cyclic AMP phosphodiesterase CpdA